jgi:aspartate/tyrosine/aromatic aminotransferase
MFDSLETLPPDPILGVNAAFRRDESPHKIDLGIGVYRDPGGNTPVPAAVHEAEQALIAAQTTKTYVGPLGNAEFNDRLAELALGPLVRSLRPRLAAIQTVGGCGALRVGAELLRAAAPQAVIHVSTPTWANHEPLVGSSGLALQRYPYYDPGTRSVDFERMSEHLGRLPAGAVVLLHACCHNPTGADLAADQWRSVAEIIETRGLLPFVDLAYQGLGSDLEADVAGLRLLAERVPEMLLAISCSKNFGLYRERVGALVVLGRSAAVAGALATHQARTARRMYSMPPDHGAAIVARVLADPRLRAGWIEELAAMTSRINSLRELLAASLAACRPDRDFSWLVRHRGMFSLLPLPESALLELRERHHIYTLTDGRMNVAGISVDNVERVADAVASLLA